MSHQDKPAKPEAVTNTEALLPQGSHLNPNNSGYLQKAVKKPITYTSIADLLTPPGSIENPIDNNRNDNERTR